MRVTVIPIDKTIIVDGNGIVLEKWDFEDSHIHAIQWFHDKGHIELKTTDPNIDLDDIDTVQPYIDAYMATLPVIEEKLLLEQEEQRLRSEKEEAEKLKFLEDQRKQKEEIEQLIEQNKKIRQEKVRLEQENTKVIEESELIKQRQQLELERIEFEKKAEIEALKHSETIKKINESDNELMERYRRLNDELEKRQLQMQEEQKKFIELIDLKEKNIENERKELELKKQSQFNLIKSERERIEREQEQLEFQKNTFETELDYQKQMVNLLRDSLEVEKKNIEKVKQMFAEEQLKNEEIANLRNQQYEKEHELYKMKVDEVETKKKLLEEDIDLKEKNLNEQRKLAFDLVEQAAERELEFFKSELQIQKEKSLNELSTTNQSEEVSLQKLEQILNELDPNEVYTKLTSGEIDENNFPVEKAVVWFSALKKAMEQ